MGMRVSVLKFMVLLMTIGFLLNVNAFCQDKDATGEQQFGGFSGKYEEYVDTYNGFKIKAPMEFQLKNKGATTDWLGPILDGMAGGIYVNAVEMKGVPSKVLYDTNFKSKKEDRNYTEVVPVKIKFGKQTVYAFRVREADHKVGSPEKKSMDEHHRWHLYVFGNNRMYTCGFTGSFASFEAKKLQTVFDNVIKSFELVPVK